MRLGLFLVAAAIALTCLLNAPDRSYAAPDPVAVDAALELDDLKNRLSDRLDALDARLSGQATRMDAVELAFKTEQAKTNTSFIEQQTKITALENTVNMLAKLIDPIAREADGAPRAAPPRSPSSVSQRLPGDDFLRGVMRQIDSYPAREAARLKALEEKQAPKTAFEEIVSGPSWLASVYPVRVLGTQNGTTVLSEGSGVAVAGDVLHTAKHLIDRINQYRVQVQVDGQWVDASAAPVANQDLMTLRVSAKLSPASLRAPQYGETCTVYGLKTKSQSQGRYAGALNASLGSAIITLEPGETTVDQGDSGGGVFGDDGALLGTISGFITDSKSVVSMVPIESASAPKVSANPPVYQAPAAQPYQNCPGGVCPAPASYQPQQYQQAPRSGRRGKRASLDLRPGIFGRAFWLATMPIRVIV